MPLFCLCLLAFSGFIIAFFILCELALPSPFLQQGFHALCVLESRVGWVNRKLMVLEQFRKSRIFHVHLEAIARGFHICSTISSLPFMLFPLLELLSFRDILHVEMLDPILIRHHQLQLCSIRLGRFFLSGPLLAKLGFLFFSCFPS